MTAVDLAALRRAVQRIKGRMTTLEQELNVADSRLGDGDTGVMLARVVDAMAQIDYDAQPDIGTALSLMARKTASATGSSLGTLIATGLLTTAKRVNGETEIAFGDIGGHIAASVEAMAARGKASLGDKTVLDILDALASALAGASDGPSAARAATDACRATLDAFRDRPCKIGRARMFGDKSIGMDDPGMLAVNGLVLAMVEPA